MRVHGVEINDEQIAAGLAAMSTDFQSAWTIWNLDRALLESGVDRRHSLDIASRLLQRERRAGRIKHIGGGKWQRV